MSDQPSRDDNADTTPFDELIASAPAASGPFTTTFRGYDKAEVDAAIAELTAARGAHADEVAQLKDKYRRAVATIKNHLATIDELEAKASTLEADIAVEQAKTSNAEEKVQTLTDELVNAADESSKGRERFEEVLRVAEEQASVIIKNASVQADRLLESTAPCRRSARPRRPTPTRCGRKPTRMPHRRACASTPS